MARNDVPAVPFPTKFLFDSCPEIGAPVYQRNGLAPAAAVPRNTETRQHCSGYSSTPPRVPGIENLSGCSVDFLLRPFTVDGRSQGLELHASQLRAALVSLLHIHRNSEEQSAPSGPPATRPWRAIPFQISFQVFSPDTGSELQGAQALSTIAKQHAEVGRLKHNLATAQSTAALQQAHTSDDAAYQESKVLRDMQRRVAAHSEEATSAWQAAEDSRAACAAAQAQASAVIAAHTHEQATLAAELADLRSKCQTRIKQALDAQDQLQRMQQAAEFSEQQLRSAQAAAHQVEIRAEQRIGELEEELRRVSSAAEHLEQQAAKQEAQIQGLTTQLEQSNTELDEANHGIRWYEGRIEELENSDTERQMRQHQADLATVREDCAAEVAALRAQLLAASAAATVAGPAAFDNDGAGAEIPGGSGADVGAGVGAGGGSKGGGRYRDSPKNVLRSLLFGDDGSDVSEGGFAAPSVRETDRGEQRVGGSPSVPPTEGVAPPHDASAPSAGEAKGCVRCRELQGALLAAAAAAGVPGTAPAAAVAAAVATAFTDAQQALHDEHMRSQALLFTLESQGSAAVAPGRGGVAAPAHATAEQGAQTERQGVHLAPGDRACTSSPKGPSDGSCAAPPSCAHTDSDARSHSGSSEAMLAQVTAELMELQAVNTRLLAKIEALQAKLQPGKLVPVAQARQLVARVKEAAASQVKV